MSCHLPEGQKSKPRIKGLMAVQIHGHLFSKLKNKILMCNVQGGSTIKGTITLTGGKKFKLPPGEQSL